MSPPRRRSTYKAPRNRREVTVAVLSSLAIIVVTAVLVWVLRPNKDSGAAADRDHPRDHDRADAHDGRAGHHGGARRYHAFFRQHTGKTP